MTSLPQSEICDPLLYRLYWKLVLSDILFHLGFEATAKNKEVLHEFHKRVLGYETISGRRHSVVSKFIQEVVIFWSVEKGIFVRTSRRQPLWIELMGFSDKVKINGKEYTVWELL
jgi:hypothetical protein